MRNFKKFDIWKKGIAIVKETYLLSECLPSKEQFGLQTQLRRAAVSIPSNIAEGCSRNSDIEFKRYLEIALGSLFEIETQFIICKELNYINEKQLHGTFVLLETEAKMINKLIQTIKKANSQLLKAKS